MPLFDSQQKCKPHYHPVCGVKVTGSRRGGKVGPLPPLRVIQSPVIGGGKEKGATKPTSSEVSLEVALSLADTQAALNTLTTGVWGDREARFLPPAPHAAAHKDIAGPTDPASGRARYRAQ
ncbi:hypothetical protein EYF80_038163 [Liparis tanakae]|uniref:Uncharacterized protein n=1 Tax=Liparis tanakae TaxID=230148 RepID=A0A4Z2GDK2_9TELE|nr:hypothetical protein EYF80_038163 [Liparis tanakae]